MLFVLISLVCQLSIRHEHNPSKPFKGEEEEEEEESGGNGCTRGTKQKTLNDQHCGGVNAASVINHF